MHNYENAIGASALLGWCFLGYDGCLNTPTSTSSYYKSEWSVIARISPFLEQGTVYSAINFDMTYDAPQNLTASEISIASLNCPSEPQPVSLPDGKGSNKRAR